MTAYSNDLVYGKNKLERIVAIEPLDDTAEIFVEDLEGKVSSQFVPNRYWILTDKQGRGCKKLSGSQHFSWGKQFTNKQEWMDAKKHVKYKLAGKVEAFMINNPAEALCVKDGYTFFKGMKHQEVSVLSFDLETTTLTPTAEGAKILLISNTFRRNNVITRKLFAYDEYDSQGAMLQAWCAWVCEMDPSVMLGHNIMSFDLPYITGIADFEGVQLFLGRDGSPLHINEWTTDFRKEAGQFIHYKGCHAYGRNIIDTLFLAIRYDVATRKYESYALKRIIAQEGLEKEGRTFYDANLIRVNYKDPVEWENIKAYCNDDSDDSLMLFDIMVPPFFYMNQSVPKTFEQMIASASGSQLNSMMVRAYLQQGHSIPKATEASAFIGAISQGVPGIHKNVLSFDVASLYPSIMREFKVCDKEKDPQEVMPQFVEFFTLERLKNKKLAKDTGDKYYDHLQNSQKIAINSFYGFLGAPGLNYNSPQNAAFVTTTGREVLQHAILWATGKEYDTWKTENNL